MDKLDTAYVAAAGSDEKEWIRRYRERFTINWWILEHDVDAKWQEIETMERHKYRSEKGLVGSGEDCCGRLRCCYGVGHVGTVCFHWYTLR